MNQSKKDRSTIPKKTADKILFLSDRTCCICRNINRPLQIHHIDENPDNHLLSNLAILCLICHDETQISGGFGRKLNAELVKLYRDEWLGLVQQKKQISINLSKSSETDSGTKKIAKKVAPSIKKSDNWLENKIRSIGIIPSFDRTVYPLDSILHIQIQLKTLIQNEPITVDIYDSKQHFIIGRKIVPLKSKNLSESNNFLYQISIPMKGNKWQLDESYVLIAKHGLAQNTDSMTVDQRSPVVQSDKSVYITNSDMILTVIAPDLDKDSQRTETIGGRDDQNITISSSLGKISKYKLRETGNSTAIFQGIVRIVSEYRFNANGKRIKEKARGNGPYNGVIPAKRGEQLDITFSSTSGTAKLTAFASNFGAVVEFDNKTYALNDKVHITIIAPDFSLGSNKKESIGDKPDRLVIIKTSKGILSKYKLSETEKNSGIFNGKISLIPHNSKIKKSSSVGHGPNNGIIPAAKKDTLTVDFQTIDETYSKSVKIK